MSRSARRTNLTAPFSLVEPIRPRVWLMRHLYATVYTVGQLARAPLATLATCAVIGITLALPGALYVVLENVRALGEGWMGGAQLSLYLSDAATDGAAERLAEALRQERAIARVEVITRAAALEEYQRLAGLEGFEKAFENVNPLPPVLVVFPTPEASDSGSVGELAARLSNHPQVDVVQSDLQWVERLNAMVQVIERAVWIVASLFALGVLLVIGNTIRLAIENRRDEIEVTRLIGASDAFIRRPFLYGGLCYGLLGALLAWLFIGIAVHLLEAPVANLSTLYHSEFRLLAPGRAELLGLLGVGAGLGWGGSWMAVTRHLRTLQPT